VFSTIFTANCQSGCLSFILLLCCWFVAVSRPFGTSYLYSSKHSSVSWWPYHSNDYVFKQFVFPPYFGHIDFTFIIIDVGELIISGHTIKVTVHTNVQLIFPLFEPHSSEHSHV
jgi:hypothetical protein